VTINDAITVAIGLAGVAGFVALLYLRWKWPERSRPLQRRLLFTDAVLVLMAAEAALDSIADAFPHGSSEAMVLRLLATLGRGAMAAAAFALLASFPYPEGSRRHRREEPNR
jgi:hypothetical protein